MQAANHNPSARRDQVTVQIVGAETLLYDERRHMALCLNATASAVWRLTDGTRGVEEVAIAASADLGVEVGGDMVYLALDDLRENGLLESDSDIHVGNAAAIESHGISRRTALARLGIGAAALLPVVASIVAPTAAQAYSGCVDCSVAGPRRVRRAAPSE